MGGLAHDLQREMHLQLLLRGNRAAAVLIVVAGGLVNSWLVPDPVIAGLSFAMAGGLFALSFLARTAAVSAATGASLALLGFGLSGMYLSGVVHDPALDQALHGAVLLPILAYTGLVGSGRPWLAGVTACTLGLDVAAWLVHGGRHPFGLAVLAYSAFYTLGTAIVAFLIARSHRRVVEVAEEAAARARRHADERQLAEARLRAILDAIPHPIFAKDRELRYSDGNAAFCALLGLPRERILGRTVLELVASDLGRVYHQADLDLLARGGVQSYESRVRFADGQERPVLFHKALVRDSAGQPVGLVGFLFDLSEHRQLQARLLEAEKLEALGRLAGGVAHDMNNQLAGILGFAELLARRLPDGPDRDDAAAIVTAATRAADLPRQLLAFARKGNYLSVPVDMHQLVDEVATLLTRSLGPGIVLCRQPEATEATVLGDPGQLQSMLLNLALNARDAMPDGGQLTFRTALAALPDPAQEAWAADLPPGRHLRIDVIDTGHGMDEHVQRRLFEPFFTTKPAGGGTGLGLASVYGAVRNHRGAIGIRSAPGRGSTFSILLPLAAAALPAAPAPTAAAGTARRILVVDDEPIVRTVLTAQLRRLGHEVLACADGAEALALEERGERLDGAILDLLLPGMSGTEIFRRLRSRRPDLPIVIASGHHDDQEAQELLREGAQAFLAKPVALERLAAVFGDARA